MADRSLPLNARQALQSVLTEGRCVRLVESDIYSAMTPDTGAHHYDSFAGFYDFLIGNRLYNRLAWGTSRDDYTAFARAAIDAAPDALYFDAGCGSMLFTASVYARSSRVVIAVDHSIGMLRRARDRLRRVVGRVPQHVLLLQADLLDLPFRPAIFRTVLSMGILHLFADAGPLLTTVHSQVAPGGQLYLSTLVLNDRAGDRHLRFLHTSGEVARLRTSGDVQGLLEALGGQVSCRAVGNMAYAVTAA